MTGLRTISQMAVVLVEACLWPTLVRGQTEDPGSGQIMAEARRLAEEARTDYDLGRFEEALQSYMAAYELFPAPGLLFNIGQCHRELGHYDRAIFFFERFLEQRPDAPNRALVRALADECRQRVDAQQRAALAFDLDRAATERPGPEEEAVDPLTGAVGRTEERGSEQPVVRKWWFWTLLGGVAVAVAAGTLAGLLVPRNEPDLPSGTLGTIDIRGSRGD